MHLKSPPFFQLDQSTIQADWAKTYEELSLYMEKTTEIEAELNRLSGELSRTKSLPRIKQRGSDYARLVNGLEYNIALFELSLQYYLSRLELLLKQLEQFVDSHNDIDLEDNVLHRPELEELFLLANLTASVNLIERSRRTISRLQSREPESPFGRSILAGKWKSTLKIYFQ